MLPPAVAIALQQYVQEVVYAGQFHGSVHVPNLWTIATCVVGHLPTEKTHNFGGEFVVQ